MDKETKTMVTIGVLALVGALVMFGVASKNAADKAPAAFFVVNVYEDDAGAFRYAIMAGKTIVHEEGPFATQELARSAGDQYILTNLTPQG